MLTWWQSASDAQNLIQLRDFPNKDDVGRSGGVEGRGFTHTIGLKKWWTVFKMGALQHTTYILVIFKTQAQDYTLNDLRFDSRPPSPSHPPLPLSGVTPPIFPSTFIFHLHSFFIQSRSPTPFLLPGLIANNRRPGICSWTENSKWSVSLKHMDGETHTHTHT